MPHKAQKASEIIESGASYTVAGGAITYPKWAKELPPPEWMQEWTNYMEFGIVFLGLIIAFLTVLWNIKRVLDTWFKPKK